MNVDKLRAAYAGSPVCVTGHTGFKGSWLALCLARMGARVHGYALAPATTPSLFELAHVGDALVDHAIADVRDAGRLAAAMRAAAPRIVFHLAAQPLVRAGYRDPVDTWSTNVMGTVNLLEAARACPSVRAVVVVTTDKCYRNDERDAPYAESDPLGGKDPYSASKAATELVAHSYRCSFFSSPDSPLLATARAGNVIGGGDWSEDRLIPDAARAIAAGQPLLIRNPAATRPWQHVLAALHGYLLLGARLLQGDSSCADAFNFGPEATDNLSVADVLTRLQSDWPELRWQTDPQAATAPHEARLLHLDSAKAHDVLGWSPRWELASGLRKTADWYRGVLQEPDRARSLTEQQLEEYFT